MIYAVLMGLLLICAYIPQLWVRHVMKRHSKRLENMPGTGGELAAHLIRELSLDGVNVEEGEQGQDHFDPSAKMVRLSPSNFKGKSLTAIAVAAHEVGHAIQCHRQEAIFRLRSRVIPTAVIFQRTGQFLMLALPFVTLLIRTPAAFIGLLAISLILQLIGALAYLIVLPEEWDASFNKALPLLLKGGYLPTEYEPAIRQVLRAAALTYFAGALANLLNIGRWALLLRR